MRTDQLSPEGAWEMLKHLEREARRRKLPGETELIEELSQLVQGVFFGPSGAGHRTGNGGFLGRVTGPQCLTGFRNLLRNWCAGPDC